MRETLARSLDRLLEPSVRTTEMWRSLGCMYLAGAAMTFATLWFGVDPDADRGAIALLAWLALVTGAVMLAVAPRIPARLMVPSLLLGLVVVSIGVIVSGEPDSPYALIYVWVGVEGWIYLRPGQAVALMLFTIALAALVMLVLADPAGDRDSAAWWAAIAVSILAVSALSGVLHGRARRLIAQLEDAAVRDALTGLLNRRGYQERLAQGLASARRHGTPLSIVLGDIDGFKALNDRHGHRHGDDALRAFAGVCTDHLREHDFVSRVGGEEFAIVLPNTTERGAVLAAERVRRAVRERLPRIDGAPVTASFGVATFPHHGTDAEVLLDHADQAMYAAKASGRDRTVAFAPGLDRAVGVARREEHVEAVLLLAETLDLRDAGTARHSQTVACLCEQIASELGLEPERVARIRLGGLLHDVGKIGVPDHVLRKPGALTDEEWEEMRKHPELGARIVQGAGLDDIAAWVLAHHERPDGRGYPYGVAGGGIPLEARILAVADAYEAMTADRPYRAAMDAEAARAELERGAGTQFDADVVAAFLARIAVPV